MTVQSWLIYLALVIASTATPGPAVLFVMTNSALHGRRKAAIAAFGNISGLFCLGIAAVAGLGTILNASVEIFDFIKYAGALYLIYLGLKQILKNNLEISANRNHITIANVSSLKIYFQAFGVAASNPKAIVFLTALFPQFVNMTKALAPQFLMLIVTLMFFSFSFLMFYALIAHNAKSWLTKPKRIKIFNRTSGTIFIGFGLLLATSSNK
jgi:threonine/homoserine/homoserine lactone efflux protein